MLGLVASKLLISGINIANVAILPPIMIIFPTKKFPNEITLMNHKGI
jgi:hypothetical protein